MDPTVAYQTMIDGTVDPRERLEAAESLRHWLDRGGFLPKTGLPFGGNTAARFYVDQKIDATIDNLSWLKHQEKFKGRVVHLPDGSMTDDRYGYIGDMASGTLTCNWPGCGAEIFVTGGHQEERLADEHWKEHTS